MALPDRRVEGVHDLVATLLVGHIGQGDPVQVYDRNEIVEAAVRGRPIDGGSPPIPVATRSNCRSDRLHRCGTRAGLKKAPPKARNDGVEGAQNMDRRHRVGCVIGHHRNV